MGVVVLVHGLTSNHHDWGPVAVRLVATGHRVIGLNQRGHGGSTVGTDGFGPARQGRDVGQTGVFRPELDGKPVTLRPAGRAEFTDRETGSRWSVAGVATDGPLAGSRLVRVAHQDAFWFAWAAFQPETVLRTP